MRSLPILLSACLAALPLIGCFHRDVATDSNGGARGQLLFGVAGQAGVDYYGVVGLPWRVSISRFDPQNVACGPRSCQDEKYTAIELVEARCASGACTVEQQPAVAGGPGFDLAIVGLTDTVDTLVVKVKRRDNGAILEDEQKVAFRRATRLVVDYDHTEDVGGTRVALLPRATTTWCPGLLDDKGAHLVFEQPRASTVFTIAPDASPVVTSEELERYSRTCLRLTAGAPGRAKVTARLGPLTREVELRVAAEADVRSMEIRKIAERSNDTATARAALTDVDDATTGAVVTDFEVVDPKASLPGTGYLAVLTLADGGNAAARVGQMSISGSAVALPLELVSPNSAVFELYGKQPGTSTVTATLGSTPFTQQLRAVPAN